MNRHTTTIIAISAVIALSLSGCTDNIEPKARSTVSRTLDRAEVARIFQIAAASIDVHDWEVDAAWVDCTDIAPDSTRFTLFASRVSPLQATPEATIGEVARQLTAAEFPVSPQHETTEDIWAVGYPHGFLGGRAADGSGFDVTASDGSAFIDIRGHCVRGDIPTDPEDPLNATPSPSDPKRPRTDRRVLRHLAALVPDTL
jgi:hypothetical protein